MSKQADGSYTADVVDFYFGPEDMAVEDRHPFWTSATIFYPDGPGPFHLLIIGAMSGFLVADRRTTLTSTQGVPWLALERTQRDTAVMYLPLPISRGSSTVNAESDATFNINTGSPKTYGPAYRGNGCTVCPQNWPSVGGAQPGYLAAYPERVHPFLDDLWLMAEKTAIEAVRHMRFYKETYNLTGHIGWYGQSGGAVAGLFPAYFLDMADATQPESQRSASSRLDWMMGRAGPPATWTVYDKTSVVAQHWGDSSSNPDWDLPNVHIEDTYIQGVLFSQVQYYGQLTAEQIALNEALPAWYHASSRTAVPASMDGVYGKSIGSIPANVETEIHSSWHTYELKTLFGDGGNVRIGVTTEAVDPLAVSNAADVILDGEEAIVADAMEWLDGVLSQWAAPEPVEEQVLQALEGVLAGVTLSAGYMTEVRAVYRFPSIPEELPILPVIAVRRAGCVKDHTKWANYTQATLNVDLDLVQACWSDSEVKLSRFIADVEKALMADHTLGNLTHNVRVTSDDRIVAQTPDNSSSIAVAFVSVQVEFRYPKTDPYTAYVTPTS